MRRTFLLSSLVLLAGCGGDSPQLEATVATLRPVRGAVRVDDDAAGVVGRLAGDARIRAQGNSLARLELDTGARVLLGADTEASVLDAATVGLTGGRLFAEVRRAEAQLRVSTPRVELRLRDASVSIAVSAREVRAYVVRGELSWTRDDERGVVGPGRRLVVDAEGARTEPATLFEDWTGGLAEPGPSDVSTSEGVGALTARVPDEVGRARWPLVVRRLDVRVEVHGDLAVTEVDQVFFNPASETLEGLYRIRVPQAAVLQRFAVDRDGVLVDGYVRERGQALAAYTEQVYRGSTDDPALLEWDGPRSYRARIYPIRPGETRRIVVRYGEWLSREGHRRRYRYPMGGGQRAPRIQELSLVADLSEAAAVSPRAGLGARLEAGLVRLRRSDFVPHADFWLDFEDQTQRSTDGSQAAWRAAHVPPQRVSAVRPGTHEADERDYWLLPLVLPTRLAGPAEGGLDLVIVADLSAGTDRAHLELGRSTVESLAGLLGPDDRVSIVGADLSLRALTDDPDALALGPADAERVERLLQGVARAASGGATDLGAVLVEAAGLLDPGRPGAVVYVGDGAPTVGERDAAGLLARLARLPDPLRLYAVGIGASANTDLLETLTAGGGLTRDVQQRRQAAEAALDLLAHARRPVAHRVTVDLGDGIANGYPRRPVDVVLGDVLEVVGRVAGAPPREVTVHGLLHGRAFTEHIPLREASTNAATDLRLRWSGARLRQLLLEGATREEVAELGVRYGMITPFTSYYVPSARELAQAAPTVTGDHEAPAPPPAVAPEPAEPMAAAPPPPRRAARRRAREARAADSDLGAERDPAARGGRAASDVQRVMRARSSAMRRCFERGLRSNPTLTRSVRLRLTIAASGSVSSAIVITSSGDGTVDACLVREAQRARFDPAASEVTVVYPFVFSGGGGPPLSLLVAQTLPLAMAAVQEQGRRDAHRIRRCSDASHLPLSERRTLWRERLERAGWLTTQVAAIRDCEVRTWRARRALLGVVLAHAGSVPAMLAVYTLLTSASARSHARAVILRRVRTPEDLRAVRRVLGDEEGIDWSLVEQILDRATTAPRQIRALRRLILQYPRSFELKLRLLEELERSSSTAAANRLASQMRADPLADPGVRTAIGELLLRRGEPEEARRAFSEIVEFAPTDELARRRLGDLYRAHGWFEQAYRQYRTLEELRPDDLGVLLLLAQAAAGAGRIDEALRLEERLAQTSEPGGLSGIGRTARLWSSVRFARLRAAADEERSARLRRRMRRTGVLGDAVDLRVSLTFAHPDAQVGLWVGRGGSPLVRPREITPEHGIEVYERLEPASEALRFEVHRAPGSRGAVDAELLLLLDEGRPDEVIRIVPLRFDDDREVYAWTLEGDVLQAAEPLSRRRSRAP